MSSIELTPIVTEKDAEMIKEIASYHGTILQGGSYTPAQPMAYTRFCTSCNRLSDALARTNHRNHIGCIYYWLNNSKNIPEYRGKVNFGRLPELIAELQLLGCVFPPSYAAAGLPGGRVSPTGTAPTSAQPAGFSSYPSWGQATAAAAAPASAQPAGFSSYPSWGQTAAAATAAPGWGQQPLTDAVVPVDVTKMTDAELAQFTAQSDDEDDNPEDEEDSDAQDDDDDDDDDSSTNSDELGYNPNDSEASDDGEDDDDD